MNASNTTHSMMDIDILLSHREWLQRLAVRLVGDPNVADDLVQETVLTALRRASTPKMREAATSPGWLTQVLKHRVLHHRRSVETRGRLEGKAAGPDIDGKLPSADIEVVEMGQTLVATVMGLPDNERDVIVMRFYHDRSYKEIATALGLSESAVRSRTQRGLAQLREKLDRDFEGDRTAWNNALTPLILAGPSPKNWSVGILVWLGLLGAVAAGLVIWGPFRNQPAQDPTDLHALAPEGKAALEAEPSKGGAADTEQVSKVQEHLRRKGRSVLNAPRPAAQPVLVPDGEQGSKPAAKQERVVFGNVHLAEGTDAKGVMACFVVPTEGSVRVHSLGRFIRPGKFQLSIPTDKAGRLVFASFRSAPWWADLDADEGAGNLSIRLERGETISGGLPKGAEGLKVSVLSKWAGKAITFSSRGPAIGGQFAWMDSGIIRSAASGSTNKNGKFELTGLAEGEYELELSPVRTNMGVPETVFTQRRQPLIGGIKPRCVLSSGKTVMSWAPATEVEIESYQRTIFIRPQSGGQPLVPFYYSVPPSNVRHAVLGGFLECALDTAVPSSIKIWSSGCQALTLHFPEDLPDPDEPQLIRALLPKPGVQPAALPLSGYIPNRVRVEFGGAGFHHDGRVIRDFEVRQNTVYIDNLPLGHFQLTVRPHPDESGSDQFLVPCKIHSSFVPDGKFKEAQLKLGGKVRVHVRSPNRAQRYAQATLHGEGGVEIPLGANIDAWKDGAIIDGQDALPSGEYLLEVASSVVGEPGLLADPLLLKIVSGQVTEVSITLEN